MKHVFWSVLVCLPYIILYSLALHPFIFYLKYNGLIAYMWMYTNADRGLVEWNNGEKLMLRLSVYLVLAPVYFSA